STATCGSHLMRFWNIVKWGGTIAVVALIAIGALRSVSNTNTNSDGSSAGSFQQQGGSSDSDRYKNLKLN
ncbi:MAG TPA: hypothetical protein VHD38_03455, partial [Candidatus Paceibacterota bacterium]|nr:hypothetical protein [Candidatus Paceibacterota bacterium]